MIDRSKVDPAIVSVAQDMEAMFLDYLMKVMRETVPENDMDLESPATKIYRGMMDSETTQRAAHGLGVGLADQIIAYLESQRYNLNQGHDAPLKGPAGNSRQEAHALERQAPSGGHHEGRPDR